MGDSTPTFVYCEPNIRTTFSKFRRGLTFWRAAFEFYSTIGDTVVRSAIWRMFRAPFTLTFQLRALHTVSYALMNAHGEQVL